MHHIITTLKKELGKNTFDYLILITSGIFFLVFLKIFQGERFASYVILLSFISFYIIWGMYHHMKEQTIHIRNMIEYIVLSFCVLLLLTLLFSF